VFTYVAEAPVSATFFYGCFVGYISASSVIIPLQLFHFPDGGKSFCMLLCA